MKKLYLFDFDGTLTRRDTMFAFLRFYHPQRFFLAMIKHLPLLIFLKLKLATAESVKKSLISAVLKGESEMRLREKAEKFCSENFETLLRPKALAFIEKIDRDKTECCIVSASLDIWLRPFAERLDFKMVCTEAEYKDGIFNGNFATPNCNGSEKVRRIKLAFNDKKFDKTVAFGDTSGDGPMMAYADESFYKFFH